MVSKHKLFITTGSAFVLWLMGVSPIGSFGKGLCLSLSLGCCIESVQKSKKLIQMEAEDKAVQLVAEELEALELALTAERQERDLKTALLPELYSPEVREELQKQLEALYKEDVAAPTSEIQTSEDAKKPLFLAIKNLLEEGKSETYVIEKILKLGGGRWAEGKAKLEEILKLGKEKGW